MLPIQFSEFQSTDGTVVRHRLTFLLEYGLQLDDPLVYLDYEWISGLWGLTCVSEATPSPFYPSVRLKPSPDDLWAWSTSASCLEESVVSALSGG